MGNALLRHGRARRGGAIVYDRLCGRDPSHQPGCALPVDAHSSHRLAARPVEPPDGRCCLRSTPAAGPHSSQCHQSPHRLPRAQGRPGAGPPQWHAVERLCLHVVEGAATGLADGRAASRDNHGFAHGDSPVSCLPRARSPDCVIYRRLDRVRCTPFGCFGMRRCGGRHIVFGLPQGFFRNCRIASLARSALAPCLAISILRRGFNNVSIAREFAREAGEDAGDAQSRARWAGEPDAN